MNAPLSRFLAEFSTPRTAARRTLLPVEPCESSTSR